MRYLNPNEGPDVQTNKFSDFLDTPNGEKSLHLSKINEEKSELEIDRVNSSFNPQPNKKVQAKTNPQGYKDNGFDFVDAKPRQNQDMFRIDCLLFYLFKAFGSLISLLNVSYAMMYQMYAVFYNIQFTKTFKILIIIKALTSIFVAFFSIIIRTDDDSKKMFKE